MTNSLPWKIHPFLIGQPSISMVHFPWRTVSHNQRVYYHKMTILLLEIPMLGKLKPSMADTDNLNMQPGHPEILKTWTSELAAMFCMF